MEEFKNLYSTCGGKDKTHIFYLDASKGLKKRLEYSFNSRYYFVVDYTGDKTIISDFLFKILLFHYNYLV